MEAKINFDRTEIKMLRLILDMDRQLQGQLVLGKFNDVAVHLK